MLLGNFISVLKDFNSNAWSYVEEAINKNSESITEINTRRIFDEGLDAEKKVLKNSLTGSTEYSPGYLRLKQSRGLDNGHINLMLSGNYLGSYGTKAESGKVTVATDTSQDDLDAILVDRFGENIKGLTEEEWAEVTADYIIPYLFEKLNF